MAGVYSVTQISSYIKNLFARDFALRDITVRGEVSNLKYHGSGHIYFTLKDANAAISCVIFASRRDSLTFTLRDGQDIEARGQISVYEKTGSYQLYVQQAALTGQGELFRRFLELKRELEEMGMFDPIYKKPIPRYAMRIGIVTSATGAAVRDIINISRRRNPYAELVLCESLVQGPKAPEDIVRGIRTLDAMGLDVIIVGRGGGSIEDLWAFNEECVARAIFDAKTPIVSAVGHETDFTIADFAADLRAPTPSAAAELCTFEFDAFEEQLSAAKTALTRAMAHRVQEARGMLSERMLRLEKRSPAASLLLRKEGLKRREARLLALAEGRVTGAKRRILEYPGKLGNGMERRLLLSKHGFSVRAGRLDALSPLKRISGGFGYLTGEDGSSIRSVREVQAGDRIRIRLRDGRIDARAERTEQEEGTWR